MIIAVPKERKNLEKRVALTPESVKILVENNIQVFIESNAGEGCNFTDLDYINCGAKICTQEEIWQFDLILKVKEPQPSEYKFFKENQTIWGFLHLSAYPKCVSKMQELNMTAIASETISKDGILSLLKPVSIIAARRAIFTAINLLEIHKGKLLCGIDKKTAGNVLIFGGGVVGENACDIAIAIGCPVTIIENNDIRIIQLKQKYKTMDVEVLKYSEDTLAHKMRKCDLLISTILIPGSKPPKLVKQYMVENMQSSSVIIDVAIDQGGCVETIDKPTTHENPIIIKHDIIHYAVANMPAAVPLTATQAIQGVVEFLLNYQQTKHETLNDGVQIHNGVITNKNLKNSFEN